MLCSVIFGRIMGTRLNRGDLPLNQCSKWFQRLSWHESVVGWCSIRPHLVHGLCLVVWYKSWPIPFCVPIFPRYPSIWWRREIKYSVHQLKLTTITISHLCSGTISRMKRQKVKNSEIPGFYRIPYVKINAKSI